MICKIFLPFCRFSSPFVKCFFCYAEALGFAEVPFVNFCSVVGAFGVMSKKTIAETSTEELLHYMFF